MGHIRKRMIIRFTPYLIISGIAVSYILKSYGGELLESFKYDNLRNTFVSYTNDTLVSERNDNLIETIPVFVNPSEEILDVIEDVTEEFSDDLEEQEINDLKEDEVSIPEGNEEIHDMEFISSELLDSGYNFKQIDFESLMQINQDVCGWITLDETNIDYPIVNGTDEENNYYLHHDLYGKESASGTIYVDTRNNSLDNKTSDLSDVTFIYGHHMKYKKMFSPICSYDNPNYINEHPYALIYTPDGYAYQLSFFAGIKYSGVDDKYVFVESLSEDDYDIYIDYLKNYSTFQSDIIPEYGDKIVALVTCEYTQGSNSRYMLFGILNKQYTNQNQISENVEQSMLKK